MPSSPAPSRPPDTLALLKAVSRSFYLSIRVLPAGLRRPIALAYLLARATDTVADTAELPPAERLAHLGQLAAAIQQGDGGASLAGLAREFAAVQRDPDERRLILELPRWVDALPRETPSDQASIRTVLGHITRGQTLDVQRFAQPGEGALASAEELHDYTWLVAGCVGEFWTDLCERHVPGFAVLPAAEMRALGRRYGCGLQLVNILRDAGPDLAQGRCYFPLDQVRAAGWTLRQVREDPRRLAPVWRDWLPAASHGLDAGMRYADALRGRRLRAGAALPALLGVRTLALMRAAGDRALVQPVKMPRAEVRALLWGLLLRLASRDAVAGAYRRLGAAAPPPGWDNPGR